MDNQRNILLAVVLSGLLILSWDMGMRYFYPQSDVPAPSEVMSGAASDPADADTVTSSTDGPAGDLGEAAAEVGPVDLGTALASENRVIIDAPRVAGSINLVGARVDDLVLKDYDETTQEGSDPVRILAPDRTDEQHYAEFGFVVGGQRMSSRAIWEADGERLTPETPVTLSRTDENGITYRVAFSIDDNYMVSAQQTVENGSENAAIVQPFALIKRTSETASPDQFIAHAGPTGVFGGSLYDPNSYEELAELGRDNPAGAVSWLGFTDNYWASALIPGEGEADSAGWRSLGDQLFRADLIYDAQTVPAGGSLTRGTQLFAGAKESAILDQYEDAGITYFGKAISWGWFEWFEKPLLWLLRTLNGLVGNFGVAIILLTVIIRGLLFPIAQKQFASMAQMKAVQPKMKAIQERYKDDKQTQQQKIMELYKEEKVNPLAGCLPLLIQIPIFFALYKVLYLAIEMRHEPFLYMSDLSAPDPAKILNLFGLLPYDVPGFLGIGILAVLLGVTMWLTFKLNPSAMDPVQQQIFNLMPWFLMFVMAPFAAGLLIYWVTSNVLTLAQQSYLYSRHPQLKAAAEKEKAEMAKKKAREDAEKSKA
ncbi:putative inner membrane protein translocase component YidC [Erythrobacter sp. NAP1]|uniref:membrane protein insertase YidC n=1 Tax=Erythrobacter sp. NAP1 TaxID=237727 RepID=UPI00006878FD|nr:membrane protein insertase YidC [Erythrobacter sp. NAP1]EAQ28162.1 putative inner membrane protein translocase component YidC [Erythrobacter sp. NAP1]